MNSKIIIFTIGTWLLFMVIAIINAILRNTVYKPLIGELRAHQLGTIIFVTLILLSTYVIIRVLNLRLSTNESFIIGTIWLISTICFEFLAGHYIFGNSWDKLLSDYNILKGRIWSLVLITIFFSPYLTSKLL